MNKKILITGATGLIGSNLSKALIERGDEVYIFTRDAEKGRNEAAGAKQYIKWDYNQPEEWQKHINNKDAVIHLAGANLFYKRWNEEYKKKIVESREISTRNLVEAIKSAQNKPGVFICASAVGYYGNKGEESLLEENNPGNDFLSKLCIIWEAEAANVEDAGVRRVSIRTGVVITPEEGALKEFLTPFKFFVGGPLGSGKQWFPWIHLKDIVRGYIFALDNEALTGAVNVSSPNPVRMKEFADILGKVLHRPSFFKVPEIALKIAVGAVAETVTASLKVIPQKLIENNFDFKFKYLEDALKDLLGKKS